MLHGKQVKDTSLSLAKIDPTTGQLLTLAGTTKIQQNAVPTLGIDLVNKDYVDSVASGLDVKKSVRAATTTSLVIASASNVVDGVTLISGDRILVKDQSIASENGIYIFNGTGNALTRSTDADEDYEVTAGLFTFVEEGLFLQETGWVLATNNPITLSSSYLTFSQFSSNGVVSASNGLTKTINDIKLGGVLTQNTVITGSNNSLYIGDLSTFTIDSTNVAINANGGDSDIYSSNNLNLTGDVSTNLISNQTNINLYASTQSVANNGNNNTIVVSDGLANKGIVYASDYSANFTPESLVSKRYVDNTISSSSLTYSNGLIKTGDNIQLGGTISQNTNIAGNSNELYFGTGGSPLYTFGVNSDFFNIYGNSGVNLSGASIAITGLSDLLLLTPNKSIRLYETPQVVSNNGSNNGLIVYDTTSSKGLVYVSDYSTNFTPESLVSKRYVDNTISSSSLTYSNGLTKTGGDVVLGGTLSQNTTITASGFDFKVLDASNLNLSGVGSTNIVNTTTNNSLELNDAGYITLGTDGTSWASTFIGMNEDVIEIQNFGTGDVRIQNNGTGDTLLQANGVSSDVKISTSYHSFDMNGTTSSLTNNGSNNSMIINDGLSNKGLVYTTDYSANFTPESLVSKRYVDNTTTSLTSSVSNGLTYSNGSIKLGGNLVENTNIDGYFSLEVGETTALSNASFKAGFNPANLYTTIHTDGAQSGLKSVNIVNDETNSIIAEDGSGVYLSSRVGLTESNFQISSAQLAISNNGANNTMLIVDQLSSKGLVYATDYSTNFTPESLVSKRYVDNKTTALTSSVSNGLTYSGGSIKLGGNLVENTNIDGAFDLRIGNNNTINILDVIAGNTASVTTRIYTDGSQSALRTDDVSGEYNIILAEGGNGVNLVSSDINGVSASAFYITNGSGAVVNNGSNNTITIDDGISKKGIVYVSDYSANFTPESLVSKRYVDTRIQTGVSASNGLYENGNYVQLGGTLSQNTNITGYGYTFSLDADTVLLTSTSSTNVMAMLEVDAVQSGWIRSDVTNGTNSSIHLMSLTQHVMLIDDSVNSSAITAVTNSISLVTDNGTNNSSLFIYNTPQTITNNGSNNNSIVTDQISSKGLVYATDYSANFTPESLVSKRYVDTQVGGILSLDNKSMTASVTTASGQQISGAITTTPKNDSYVSVYINGLKMKLGNGVTTYDVYFADSGNLAVARTIANIQSGDVLVRGTGLGYDTDATDLVDYDFQF